MKEITNKDIQAVRNRTLTNSVAQIVTGDIVEAEATETKEEETTTQE
jgi:hypothetical protein